MRMDVLQIARVRGGNANRCSMCVDSIYCCDIQSFLEAPQASLRGLGWGRGGARPELC